MSVHVGDTVCTFMCSVHIFYVWLTVHHKLYLIYCRICHAYDIISHSLQDVMLEKFAQRQPSCVAYDEKMHFYTHVVSEVDSHPALKEVEFARLNMEPLATALKENARQWVAALGKRLNDSARSQLTELKTKLEVPFIYVHKVYMYFICIILGPAIQYCLLEPIHLYRYTLLLRQHSAC